MDSVGFLNLIKQYVDQSKHAALENSLRKFLVNSEVAKYRVKYDWLQIIKDQNIETNCNSIMFLNDGVPAGKEDVTIGGTLLLSGGDPLFSLNNDPDQLITENINVRFSKGIKTKKLIVLRKHILPL